MRPGALCHVSVNTGDVVLSRRAEVSDDEVEVFQQLVASARTWKIPSVGHGFTCTVTADGGGVSTFDVSVEFEGEPGPVVFCVLCTNEAMTRAAWDLMSRLSLRFLDGPLGAQMAAKEATVYTPWLAVLLMPGAVVAPDASAWIGDFQRCLAWALIEREAAG